MWVVKVIEGLSSHNFGLHNGVLVPIIRAELRRQTPGFTEWICDRMCLREVGVIVDGGRLLRTTDHRGKLYSP